MADYSDVEAFLNDRDANRPCRREHHLPREDYHRTDAPFFITCCARHHGEPFRDATLAQAVVEAINWRRETRVWRVYAYCLMPDHPHAVVQLLPALDGQPPPKDLLQVLGDFRSITTRAAWQHGLHGRLWQHDQHDRLLRNEREFGTRCQYVLDNPVRKGWVEHWTQWPHAGILDEW